MSKVKTNAIRILDKHKISYELMTYEAGEAIDGVSVANKIGRDPEEVFKTLVTRGNSKEIYVFVIPVAKELDLKKFINSDADIQRQIEDIKTIRSEILENATAEIESIDFMQRASDNLKSEENPNEEQIEMLLPSLLLLHMEMSNYLREEAEWSQLLNNKTALYVTGRTCDHGEYSVLYAILSTYYEMIMKNHIVFITDGNIK